MPLTEIILCFKAIQETKFYLRTGFWGSKRSCYWKMLEPLQELCQWKGGSPKGWFLISWILILYLKEKVHCVEIKATITGDYFKLENHDGCQLRRSSKFRVNIIYPEERGIVTTTKKSGCLEWRLNNIMRSSKTW